MRSLLVALSLLTACASVPETRIITKIPAPTPAIEWRHDFAAAQIEAVRIHRPLLTVLAETPVAAAFSEEAARLVASNVVPVWIDVTTTAAPQLRDRGRGPARTLACESDAPRCSFVFSPDGDALMQRPTPLPDAPAFVAMIKHSLERFHDAELSDAVQRSIEARYPRAVALVTLQ